MAASNAMKQGFLLLLVGTATVLMALIVAPFAGALFAAAVFATVTFPLQRWLSERLGGHPSLSAGLLTLGGLLIVVVPMLLLAAAAIDQMIDLHRDAERTLQQEGLEGLVQQVPEPLRPAARSLGGYLFGEVPAVDPAAAPPEAPGEAPSEVSAEAPATAPEPGLNEQGFATVATIAGRVFDALAGITIDLGLTVLAFFFLLAQGRRLVEWVVGAVPLPEQRTREMLSEFRSVTRGVFFATIATALIQSALAAAAYVIAGVDFLAAAIASTFVAAMIPIIGGAVVVGAIGAVWILQGETGYGVFLLIYGIVVVGLSDNIVKPWLAKDSARLPGSVVLFAMLGGLAVFGPMGIVAGPLIVAFFLASLRLVAGGRAAAAPA